jgi:L-fuculose-phosphate aldolase
MSAEQEKEKLLREELISYGRQAYDLGFVSEFEGNLSARLGPDRILMTPSQMPYPQRTVEDVALLDLNGNQISGTRKFSSEHKMHLSIYKARPDVNAVVHCHSLYLSVLAVMGEPLKMVLDEMTPFLGGDIQVSKFAGSGTQDLADYVVEALGQRNGALVANHGHVSVSGSLQFAWVITKAMEKFAHIYYLAYAAGKPRTVPEERQKQLLQYFEMMKTRRAQPATPQPAQKVAPA